ncbi:MAG: flagellar assembly protein FliX [Rhodospirillales bacterium]|nr:flagellar assembly protein FliX [Alphaproteobacteria bacterium]MCB9987131.1 flagellar assembly protein FliX [Rhodospirillales bacterium]USO08111.1 MAG: flagellar assembly protein FliX [Rhodospirillales bacterium]
MRIEGPNRSSDVKKSGKARKSGDVSSSFGAFLDSDVEEADGPRGGAPVMGVGSLLAAQAAEDPTERKARKRMTARAGKVLDALEGVHRGLLSGQITAETLERVSASVAERREKIEDPALSDLLDQVDLRAQVEMAKMEMARDTAKNKNS